MDWASKEGDGIMNEAVLDPILGRKMYMHNPAALEYQRFVLDICIP